MGHSQRCISANRFGDGFDCICDEEPLAQAQKRIQELEAQVEELKGYRKRDVAEMAATIQRNFEYERQVAELESKLADAVALWQDDSAKAQAIISKLEDRLIKMMTAMAEVEARITVAAAPEIDPVMVDRDEAMLWAVMLSNARHVKPDRIRELAIAYAKARDVLRKAVIPPPREVDAAAVNTHAELIEEVERVLKEQAHEEAVQRDLKLYGEVTDGTMFANPPPRDIGQEILEGVRELKKEEKDEP